MKKYNVYRNTIIRSQSIYNQGDSWTSLVDESQYRDGYTEYDSDKVATLSVDDNWDIAISEAGNLLFWDKTTGTVVNPDGTYSESLTTIAKKYNGFAYHRRIEDEAEDIYESERWRRILQQAIDENPGP